MEKSFDIHNAEAGYCNAPWLTEKVYVPFLLGVSECRCKNFGIEAITFCSCVQMSTTILKEIRIKCPRRKEMSKEKDWPSSPCPSMHGSIITA
jgi:hypothetical protein